MTIFFETRDNIHVMLSIDQMKKKKSYKIKYCIERCSAFFHIRNHDQFENKRYVSS